MGAISCPLQMYRGPTFEQKSYFLLRFGRQGRQHTQPTTPPSRAQRNDASKKGKLKMSFDVIQMRAIVACYAPGFRSFLIKLSRIESCARCVCVCVRLYSMGDCSERKLHCRVAVAAAAIAVHSIDSVRVLAVGSCLFNQQEKKKHTHRIHLFRLSHREISVDEVFSGTVNAESLYMAK